MNKIDEELLINYYFYGYELSSENKPFPFWFSSYEEKISCLSGYQDFDLGVVRSEMEIIELIKGYL